jgi:hypothetical protein
MRSRGDGAQVKHGQFAGWAARGDIRSHEVQYIGEKVRIERNRFTVVLRMAHLFDIDLTCPAPGVLALLVVNFYELID